jgi:small nuclear ribonucleoprotein (snRNP)-like protein
MELDAEKKKYAAIYKKITVKTTDGELILGKVNLSSKQRVSDIFTRSDLPFIVLIDASSKDVSGKTLFINKDHILWVEPEFE